eukprot:5640949-Pleurochrysis_carterae.AAC.5
MLRVTRVGNEVEAKKSVSTVEHKRACAKSEAAERRVESNAKENGAGSHRKSGSRRSRNEGCEPQRRSTGMVEHSGRSSTARTHTPINNVMYAGTTVQKELT